MRNILLFILVTFIVQISFAQDIGLKVDTVNLEKKKLLIDSTNNNNSETELVKNTNQGNSTQENKNKDIGEHPSSEGFGISYKIGHLLITQHFKDKYKSKETSIIIKIENNTIKKMNVYLKDDSGNYKLLSNKGFIPFKTAKQISNWKNYKLYCNGEEYCSVSDVIFYIPDTTGFLLADTSIFVSVKNDKNIYLNSKRPNQMLKFSLYTDILGLFDEIPAGIIQTEASMDFVLNTVPIRKSTVTLLNSFSPFVSFSKFRDKYRVLTVAHDSNKTMLLNTIKLQQYSSFQAGININLLNLGIPAWNTEFNVTPFSNIYITKVKDSVENKKELDTNMFVIEYNTRQANFIGGRMGANLIVKSNPFPFLGFEGGVKAYVNWVINTPYEFNLENKVETLGTLNDNLFNGQAQLNYSWFMQVYYSDYNNSNNALFFRVSYIGAIHNPERFITVQIGLKANLENFLSKSTSAFSKK